MAIKVRHDIWQVSLGSVQAAVTQPWHPVLDTYARGIARMQAGNNLDAGGGDPTVDSWFWAAFTHGIPNGVQSKVLWDQCEHSSLYFLPWHRAYLAWFENTIRVAAADPGWALPYWDYSDPTQPNALMVPPEFTVPQRTVDGQLVDNVLFQPETRITTRRPPGPIPGSDVEIVAALTERRFVRDHPGKGFGGVIDAAAFAGLLETEPHNFVHGAIGGLMNRTTTAGLDPIFWVHHANIDRLWEVWRALPGSTPIADQDSVTNALRQEWSQATFRFGSSSAPDEYRCQDMDRDPEAVLEYRYENVELTRALRAEVLAARGIGGPMGLDDTDRAEEWQPVASEPDIVVPPTGAERRLAFAGTGPGLGLAPRIPSAIVVELAAVKADQPHPVYLVEMRAADDAPWRPAGRISTFGLLGTPADETRSFLVDASAAIPALEADGWRGGGIDVRLRPDLARDDGPDDPEITVGRLTVHTSRT